MNRKQRQAKLERAQAHHAKAREARRARGIEDRTEDRTSGRPPRPPRKRPLPKRAVRALGRKLRPE